MSLAFKTLALTPIEGMINRALSYDPGSTKTLATLAEKTLSIEVTAPSFLLCITFLADGKVALSSEIPETPDAYLSGHAVALANLAMDSDKVSLVDSGVDINGDQALVQAIRDILRKLEIDWEAALASIIGDLPAHFIAEAVRTTHNKHADTGARVASGLADFVREESGLTVGNYEASSWFANVRHLAADTDRLQARFNKLQRQLDELETK